MDVLRVAGIRNDESVWGKLYSMRRDDAGKWSDYAAGGGYHVGLPSGSVATTLAVAGDQEVALYGGQPYDSGQPGAGALVPGYSIIQPGLFTELVGAAVGRDSHYAGLVMGTPWHTLRRGDGSWQDRFRNMNEPQNNRPGLFGTLGMAGVGSDLHVVGAVGGSPWHTFRRGDGSWQGFWGSVNSVHSNRAGSAMRIACGGVGSELHVVILTPDGRLHHTLRRGDGSWQGYYGDVNSVNGGNPGSFTWVGAAGVGDKLHICGVSASGLWHTFRRADGSWQGEFKNVHSVFPTAPERDYMTVACSPLSV